MVKLRADIGWVAKHGRAVDENEDRAAAGPLRFAVADGASDAARAEVWAELLVRAYATGLWDPADPVRRTALTDLRMQWRDEVWTDRLPWYAAEKLGRGSAATFVGLTLEPATCRYQAVAVGDSCVLHLRGDELLISGPVTSWQDFGRYPDAIRTRPDDDGEFDATLWQTEGRFEDGDIFVLASDALSKFLLRRYGEVPGDTTLPDLATGDAFAEWVRGARVSQQLDNDDTTICVVRC